MTSSFEELQWERIGANTTWGKYISDIERAAILRAQQLVPQPGQALEVGCEGGRWSVMLSELGWNMTCTDINAKSLEVAKARLPSAKFVQVQPADESLPCDRESMDLLLCVEVFHVVHARWFLTEAARVLRPGGVLVGVTTNSRSLRGLGYRAMSGIDRERKKFLEESQTYTRSYRDWKRQIASEGFRLKYEEGFCWLPFGRESNSRWVPFATGLERRLGLRRLISASPWIVFIAQR